MTPHPPGDPASWTSQPPWTDQPTAATITERDGHLTVTWPTGRGLTTCTPEVVEGWAEQVNALRAEVELLRGILGDLHLYVDWRYVTSQLTTVQKEAWAQAVEQWERDLYADDPDTLAELHPADRWWLCPTCGISIRAGRHDGPHEHCMWAHDKAGPATAQGDPS